MSSVTPSQNPFISGPLPRKGETPQERSRREREEARAKAVSDAIDKQIEQDKVAFQRYRKAVKVLLLGQSESGKSTMIKNFQLAYGYSAWVRERSLWKVVIYLNLIGSVTAILEAMDRAMKEQHDRHQCHQRPLSPHLSSDDHEPAEDTAQDPVFEFSEKHRLLQLRLTPLIHVRKDLEEHLGSAFEPDQVETAFHTTFPSPDTGSTKPPRHYTRFSASGNGSWGARYWGDEFEHFTGGRSTQDLRDTLVVLYCCGPDIKQLWEDEVVEQVLKENKPPLECSVFSMDDINRLLERNYEPSDQDIVKARLRTLGVQEYHFVIPREGWHQDLVLYDVGGSRTSRHAWCSYFDNINAIVFLAPVSCFDQTLAEDSTVNRLQDSLIIWRQVCNSKLLENVELILFLNKTDLLKEKLESGVRFKDYIVNYGNRPNDVDSVTSFLFQKFKAIHRGSGSQRPFHFFLTPTFDVKVVRTILETVRGRTLHDFLERAGTI